MVLVQFKRWGMPALLGIVFALGSSCSASDEILGGDEVGARDPISKSVIALVRVDKQQEFLCSATLIAKDMALTAAHCVEDGVQGMTAVFGPSISGDDSSPVSLAVVDSAVPDVWTQNHGADRDTGDIAVVRLESEIPEGFHPARFMGKSQELADGDEVILAGYGISNAADKSGAGVLRKASVKIAKADFSDTEILLDQTQGAGACHGDSGGPAFLNIAGREYLFGVTSRGDPAAAPDDCAHQVVYTRTSAYRRWITEAMKELRGQT